MMNRTGTNIPIQKHLWDKESRYVKNFAFEKPEAYLKKCLKIFEKSAYLAWLQLSSFLWGLVLFWILSFFWQKKTQGLHSY